MAGDPARVDVPIRAVLFGRLYGVLVPVSHGRRILRHATALPAARGAGRLRGGAHPSQRVLAGAPIAVAGHDHAVRRLKRGGPVAPVLAALGPLPGVSVFSADLYW